VIFVTVGTQLAFDRLIAAVDGWAGQSGDREVFAQIGPSRLRPQHIDHGRFVSPQECADRMRAADAIIAHAGMGTILTALEMGKPLLVMPRRAELGEHRNNHQLATATRFSDRDGVMVALDEIELAAKLDELNRVAVLPAIGHYAPDSFVSAVRAFIVGEPLVHGAHEAPRALV
jgi:UDP-N-acetylglucosamine transferase subunit ALG13